MAHSPGPWFVAPSDDDQYGDISVVNDSMTRVVARLALDDAPVHDFNREQYANARLIAASPLLLDAAHDAWRVLSNYDQPLSLPDRSAVLATLYAAIKTATGEAP